MTKIKNIVQKMIRVSIQVLSLIAVIYTPY